MASGKRRVTKPEEVEVAFIIFFAAQLLRSVCGAPALVMGFPDIIRELPEKLGARGGLPPTDFKFKKLTGKSAELHAYLPSK